MELRNRCKLVLLAIMLAWHKRKGVRLILRMARAPSYMVKDICDSFDSLKMMVQEARK